MSHNHGWRSCFRRIFRNTRRSLTTTLTIAIGTAATLIFGAYTIYVTYGLQTATVQRTGHLTEFVPLPYVHMGAPLYLRGEGRPGPTWDEVLLMHAVARLALRLRNA